MVKHFKKVFNSIHVLKLSYWGGGIHIHFYDWFEDNVLLQAFLEQITGPIDYSNLSSSWWISSWPRYSFFRPLGR